MREQAPQRPIKEFRAGGVKLAIWQNTAQQNGRRVIRHTVRIGKRYFDQQRNAWVDSEYFLTNDLPRLRLLVEKAFEYVTLSKPDLDAPEAPDDVTIDATPDA